MARYTYKEDGDWKDSDCREITIYDGMDILAVVYDYGDEVEVKPYRDLTDDESDLVRQFCNESINKPRVEIPEELKESYNMNKYVDVLDIYREAREDFGELKSDAQALNESLKPRNESIHDKLKRLEMQYFDEEFKDLHLSYDYDMLMEGFTGKLDMKSKRELQDFVRQEDDPQKIAQFINVLINGGQKKPGMRESVKTEYQDPYNDKVEEGLKDKVKAKKKKPEKKQKCDSEDEWSDKKFGPSYNDDDWSDKKFNESYSNNSFLKMLPDDVRTYYEFYFNGNPATCLEVRSDGSIVLSDDYDDYEFGDITEFISDMEYNLKATRENIELDPMQYAAEEFEACGLDPREFGLHEGYITESQRYKRETGEKYTSDWPFEYEHEKARPYRHASPNAQRWYDHGDGMVRPPGRDRMALYWDDLDDMKQAIADNDLELADDIINVYKSRPRRVGESLLKEDSLDDLMDRPLPLKAFVEWYENLPELWEDPTGEVETILDKIDIIFDKNNCRSDDVAECYSQCPASDKIKITNLIRQF